MFLKVSKRLIVNLDKVQTLEVEKSNIGGAGAVITANYPDGSTNIVYSCDSLEQCEKVLGIIYEARAKGMTGFNLKEYM